MPSPTDPLTTERRRARGEAVLLFAGLLGVLVWAVWPIEPPAPMEAELSAPETGEKRDADRTAPLNLAAFDKPLWHVPPEPEAPAPARTAASVRPPSIEILAVIASRRPDGTIAYEAAIADDDEMIRMVRVGDRIDGHTVRSIEPEGMAVERGAREFMIAFDDGGAP